MQFHFPESSCKFFTVVLCSQLAQFSSQLVCATWLASRSSRSSLRSLRRASPRLSPRSRRAIVGPRRFLQDFGRSRKDRGEIEEGWAGIWSQKQRAICTSTCCESCLFWMRRGKCRQFCIWLDLRPHWLPRRRWHRDCLVSVVVAGAVLHHHAADGVVRCSNASLKRCLQHTLVFRVELAPLRRVVSN